MISVENWKFHLSLFLDKMSLDIMSDDHPSSKLALLNYKNINFTKSWNCIFLKELTHDFGQKLKIYWNWQYKPRNHVSWSSSKKKKRPPSLYKYGFHVVMIMNFFKVVKRWLSSKNENLTFWFLNKMGFEKMFDHHLVRETSPPRRK